MRNAKACRQCRASKRKCTVAQEDSHLPCIPCHRRNIGCSKTLVSTTSGHLRPRAQGSQGEDDTTALAPPLSSEETVQLVELYLRFLHDRPHSLFHEKTLWEEIRSNLIPESLLLAICAMSCRFSDKVEHRNLGPDLTRQSSDLFSKELETISLSNIQTAILLANLYAAEEKNQLEALYFGIANRMAYILRLHEQHLDDTPVLREIKCRVWWSLFIADRWCPPGLGLPRQILMSDCLLELPMDEKTFQDMDGTAHFFHERRDGLWKYMVTLVDILGPIQDLNQSLVRQSLPRGQVNEQVAKLTGRLDAWRKCLPEHMTMNDENLESYRRQRRGGTFVALHFGYHHYRTLLYFQYLDSASEATTETTLYVNKCRFHALSFSNLLRSAREKGDCIVVYLTVAHMAIVSSSVLLHMLLFGNDDEVDVARSALSSNFGSLVELKRYWPLVDKLIRRLLSFQNACLRATDMRTHKIDRWMVTFLLEYGLPLGEKESSITDQAPLENPLPRPSGQGQPFERADMLSGFFSALFSG